MEGSFFPNPTFPNNDYYEEEKELPTYLDSSIKEQSYIENILRLNKGKKARAYVSYPDSSSWQNKVYDGIIKQAGKDHLIMEDPKSGTWYLIRLIYLDYMEFDEKINYDDIPFKN